GIRPETAGASAEARRPSYCRTEEGPARSDKGCEGCQEDRQRGEGSGCIGGQPDRGAEEADGGVRQRGEGSAGGDPRQSRIAAHPRAEGGVAEAGKREE